MGDVPPHPGAGRRCPALRGGAPAEPLGARLLAPAGIGVQRAALDGLVDQRDELAVLVGALRFVAGGDGRLEAAEGRLDLRRVVAVLEPLPLRALIALDLGLDVGHACERRGTTAAGAYYSAP